MIKKLSINNIFQITSQLKKKPFIVLMYCLKNKIWKVIFPIDELVIPSYFKQELNL